MKVRPAFALRGVCAILLYFTVRLGAQTVYVPGGTLGTSNGSAGIGTSSPQAKLHVLTAAYAGSNYVQYPTIARLENNADSGLALLTPTSNNAYVGHATPLDGGSSFITFMGSLRAMSFHTVNGAERMRIDNVGNVGIGTTNPGASLDVYKLDGATPATIRIVSRDSANGAPPFSTLEFRSSTPTDSSNHFQAGRVQAGYDAGSYSSARLTLSSVDSSGNYLETISLKTGNVGIGTTNPISKLHVMGGSVYVGTVVADAPTGGYSSFGLYENSAYKASMYWHPSVPGVGFYGAQTWFFESGNVGIGTTNPGTNKLAVNGTIRAKEVIVEASPWPDYVFADNYRLAPLSEVEAHIKAQRHLPGIPSAAEVAENGVTLGEMQAKLLAKIEELMLHQIEQEKRHNQLRADFDRLRAENAELRQAIYP